MPQGLPPGVTRGPDGKFVSHDGAAFDDIEVWNSRQTFRFDDSNPGSRTSVQILDMEDLVDRRREEAELLYARFHAEMTVFAPAVDTDPPIHRVGRVALQSQENIDDGAMSIDGHPPNQTEALASDGSDNLDLILPVLQVQIDGYGGAEQNSGFDRGSADTAEGVNGVNLASPRFHARDELFVAYHTGGDGDGGDHGIMSQVSLLFGLRES